MARSRPFGTIRKLPSGRYQARYSHLGKQIAADHTFTAKTDARRWLSTIEADMVRGTWIDPEAGAITFGEYADW
ncbi:MAG: site-specific integrase, partial [Planctomycetota bacterium]